MFIFLKKSMIIINNLFYKVGNMIPTSNVNIKTTKNVNNKFTNIGKY